ATGGSVLSQCGVVATPRRAVRTLPVASVPLPVLVAAVAVRAVVGVRPAAYATARVVAARRGKNAHRHATGAAPRRSPARPARQFAVDFAGAEVRGISPHRDELA